MGDVGRVLVAMGIVWIVIVTIVAVANALRPYDATDPPGGRSGLRIFADTETGCRP